MCNCYVIEKGICGGGRDVCCVLRYLVSDRILIFSVFGNSYPTPPPHRQAKDLDFGPFRQEFYVYVPGHFFLSKGSRFAQAGLELLTFPVSLLAS